MAAAAVSSAPGPAGGPAPPGTGPARRAGGGGQRLTALQEEAVRYALSKGGRALLALPPGRGKTAIALHILLRLSQEKSFPALVLSPASNCAHWLLEAQRWCGMRHRPETYKRLRDAPPSAAPHPPSHLCVIQEGRDLFPLPGALLYIMSYEMACALATAGRFEGVRLGSLVVDESHRLQNPRSKIAWTVMSHFNKQQVPFCLCLTGTPANRTRHLWPQLRLLCPEKVWNKAEPGMPRDVLTYEEFVLRYCGGQYVRRGFNRATGRPIHVLDAGGSTNLDELCRRLSGLCLFTGAGLARECGVQVFAGEGPRTGGEFTFRRTVVWCELRPKHKARLARLWQQETETAARVSELLGGGGGELETPGAAEAAAPLGAAAAEGWQDCLLEFGGLPARPAPGAALPAASALVAARKRRRLEDFAEEQVVAPPTPAGGGAAPAAAPGWAGEEDAEAGCAPGARPPLKRLCKILSFSLYYQDAMRIKAKIAARFFKEHVRPLLRERSPAPHKCLLFCHNQSFVELLEGLLRRHTWGGEADPEARFVVLTGSTPQPKRPELIRRFQQDPRCQAAVLSILAAGQGVHLTAANHVFFFQLTWNGGDLLQAEKRACRMGQRRHVDIKLLVLDCFIERRQLELNLSKIRNQASVLNQQELAAHGLACETETFRAPPRRVRRAATLVPAEAASPPAPPADEPAPAPLVAA